MEFGSTPPDWFQLVHQLTGDPFIPAANSRYSYTANGFQANALSKKKTSKLGKCNDNNVQPMIFSYPSSYFYLTGEASLKDGITYQQMQVSFSERRAKREDICANLFQMLVICKTAGGFCTTFYCCRF